MADRRVRQTGKDRHGEITKLCNPHTDWQSVFQATAIVEIEHGLNTYYVHEGSKRSDIEVVTRANGSKYLRTERDGVTENNLDNLDDC